jgi:hypothetical protein
VKKGIARRSDVDGNSVVLKADEGAQGSYQPGTITFRAAEGQSIDIEKLHESIKSVRRWDNTRSKVTYLEITATGEASRTGTEVLFKVAGTGQILLLAAEPPPAGTETGKTPYARLQAAIAEGNKVIKVTGRIEGWNGLWGTVLKDVPGQQIREPNRPPMRRMKLVVTAFDTDRE